MNSTDTTNDTDVKILMVEDDINLGYLLKENFATKGMQVHLARDGEEGWKAFKDMVFDIVLLDIMMPKKDGFSLAKMIRRDNPDIPLIFLTAKAMEEDKIEGFNMGCDDFITKPFSARELQLRIQAILKRVSPKRNQAVPSARNAIHIGRFTFDYENRHLTYEHETKKLSTKEADLLLVFCENRNALLNRSIILKRVWENDDYFAAKSMDVYLTRIRKLLRNDPCLEIQNVHGTGFRLLERPA